MTKNKIQTRSGDMSYTVPPEKSLVLYKNRAAWIIRVGDKIEIETEDGKTLQVRPKDVQLLHPGPMQGLAELTSRQGEVQTAWELLAGSTTDLAELAELVYGEYTPATAWAAWQLVTDGLYFAGEPEAVEARTEEAVAEELSSRAAREAEARAWAAFLERAGAGRHAPEDSRYLQEVEALALKQRATSQVLRVLGRSETPEAAHTLLLEVGYWDTRRNPYPQRLGLPTGPPAIALPELPEESRVDLTHLPAFAIDDEGNQDPDDALSLEPDRLWVHIADVAALVPPDSPADLEARTRGASLYLPEGTTPMLPPQATQLLGLGLNEVSPALSFGLDINDAAEVTGIEILPSWVRVQRLTYQEVESRLDEAPFSGLRRLAQASIERRAANNAVLIDLPEVKIRLVAGQIEIRPILPLQSRDLVTEAMLLCGTALADFAREKDIAIPYITQSPPRDYEPLEGMAGMFAIRRAMYPSQRKSEPGPHAGLGLPAYTHATSPLRRYADLLVHQQVRAYLRGEELLSSPDILERIGVAEAVSGSTRQAERLSYKHWTLVYLLENAAWRGEGVLVEKFGQRGLILAPELDLEARQYVSDALALNSVLSLAPGEIKLPELDIYFKIL